MWKPFCLVLLAVLVSGCFATHEPPPIAQTSVSPIPLAVAARYEPPEREPDMEPYLRQMLDESDRETEHQFAQDLRDTGLFRSVEPASAVTQHPDLIAIRLPFEIDETSYCGEVTVAPAILTAGLVPGRGCHRAYEIRFVSESTGQSLDFQDQYSADTWFGWIPLFMNLRDDWHWYGPPHRELRIAYLRRDLSEIRIDLLNLAGAESN